MCQFYNSIIHPVQTGGRGYRLTVGLRHINDLIVALPAFVPDITNILKSIQADHTYFSVFDLCSAFHSVPVDVETQPLLSLSVDSIALHGGSGVLIDGPATFARVVHETLTLHLIGQRHL